VTWLIIVALGVWALFLHRRLDKLETYVRTLSSAPRFTAPNPTVEDAPPIQDAPIPPSWKPPEPVATPTSPPTSRNPRTPRP
jgi:hypothetical protein